MIRGVCFEVPNKRFPVIYIILKNIDIKKYFWILIEDDVYDEIFNGLLKNDRYQGVEFEKIIKNENCYAVFLNLQAYLNENDFIEIKNYDDYLKSKCELVLFIDDNIYVDIYAKDKDVIEIIKKNAENNKFKNIKYITDENDTRKNFVFNIKFNSSL